MSTKSLSYSIRPENEFGLMGEIIGDWVQSAKERRARRRAVGQLRSMTDNQLKDIGVSRSEIGFVARTGRRFRR